MLWIKVKVGESVSIDKSTLTLIDKSYEGILVSLDGEHYSIDRGEYYRFPTFTLHSGTNPKGLRLGFEAPKSVVIRRKV